jgi:cytoskeletal protein RodZ
MLPGALGDSFLLRPTTRYLVRPLPVVAFVAVVLWLALAAMAAGRWGQGVAVLGAALVISWTWLLVRRARLRRHLVLPPSQRSERRAVARAAANAAGLTERPTGRSIRGGQAPVDAPSEPTASTESTSAASPPGVATTSNPSRTASHWRLRRWMS